MSRRVSMIIYLLIPLQASWSSEKAAPQFTFSKKGSYHFHRMSLIILHMFGKYIITLSISTSLESQKPYHICIQLVTAIVLHTHKTLLCPLSEWWLSLFAKFIPYMNGIFFWYTDPATSSRRTRTRARTNQWDMTAEQAFSCLCVELKHSVDKSWCLDDAKQVAS